MIEQLVSAISESALREAALWALFYIPGLPPILQSLHIISIALLFASIGMTNLRFLKLALPSHSPSEMIIRLAPLMWASLTALFATGSIFVIARPARYFYNPVAGVKLLTLTLASILTVLLIKYAKKQTDYWDSSELRVRTAQFISLLSIILWVITILAGRWIAYLDYLI